MITVLRYFYSYLLLLVLGLFLLYMLEILEMCKLKCYGFELLPLEPLLSTYRC